MGALIFPIYYINLTLVVPSKCVGKVMVLNSCRCGEYQMINSAYVMVILEKNNRYCQTNQLVKTETVKM